MTCSRSGSASADNALEDYQARPVETSGVLFTIGHGSFDRQSLGGRLTGRGIEALVDVRRFPGSRTNPDARRDELTCWLRDLGIGYRWEPRLGGRRRLPAGETSPDSWWTVPAFRAYAAHTRTLEFAAALDDVVTQAASIRVVIMCAESLWWRCHRRLISDVVMLTRARTVRHMMPDGHLSEHRVAAGARLNGNGTVLWDRGESTAAAIAERGHEPSEHEPR